MRTLVERLGELDAADFRVRGRTKHKASEIACMTICAQIAGATSFYDMHSYATEKLGWFRGFPKLENGVPSHDTFRRFWKHSAPARLNSIFMEWVDETCALADGDGIHIDGKCLRRAVTKLGKQPCIVSAYSSNERIVIGQVKADEKSNEITAIPNLIDTLYLMGCIVTIDAAGCQKKIVRKIVDRHADYLISLKGNQSTMHDEIRELFETKFSDRATRFKTYEATQKGHGRVTKRTCCQTDYLEWFADRGKWAGLASVVMIDTECLKQKTGETTKDRRFFISSLPVNPKRALELAVSHWDIENPLHWTLDMVFDEDHSRASSGFAAENLAILRHLEFNLIRRDKVTEGGMSRKKKTMTWNEDKLLKALFAA